MAFASVAVLGGLALGAPSCRPTASLRPLPTKDAATAPQPALGGRLHALLLNGGGRRETNYFSHLDHLRRMLTLLEQAGVEPANIAVFSADGADPRPDLATRDPDVPPDFWLLPRRIDALLRPQVVFADSRLDGIALRPARRDGLQTWFQEEGRTLEAGDVLLLYVTDHGERRGVPPEDTITLWHDQLTVPELRELLASLAPGVQVVLVMSQCFSGGFAGAALPPDDAALPDGRVCGYFSTTAERRAHGCYAEVSKQDSVGHSHRLLTALAAGFPLREAQRETLVSDDTPDVPLATSGLFLEQHLGRAAQGAGLALPAFVDPLLGGAFQQATEVEPEIRLLDRMGEAFGLASPRSLAELETQTSELSALSERLETFARLWQSTLDALREENLRLFRAANPEWGPRLEPKMLQALDAEGRRRESDALLDGLGRFTAGSRERQARLEELHWKAEESQAAHYRAEVRLGVVLRMRALLLEIAGGRYLTTSGSEQERTAFERLAACEQLPLVGQVEAAAPATPRAPFPTLAQERRALERLLPGWLGIRYRALQPNERSGRPLPRGAAVVLDVVPEGPGAGAGLEPGDVLLGPPGEPFQEPHAVREWTMREPIGASRSLLVLRGEEEWEARIRLVPYPLGLPTLPGPPELGQPAPPLDLTLLANAELPRAGEPRLLFFFATWCQSCKRALPELAAFSSAQGIPVVAITDEDEGAVERFAVQHAGLLPSRVATDRRREQFRRYGVSGTPTFVFVDGAGVVRSFQVGYDPHKGIGFEGWRWSGLLGAGDG